MKKILVLFIFLSALPVMAQEVDFSYGQNTTKPYNWVYKAYGRIGLPVSYKSLSVIPWGSWETWAEWRKMNGRMGGAPFRETYGFGVKVEFKAVFVEYAHYCRHNVTNYYDEDNERYIVDQKYGQKKMEWDDMLDLVTVGVHFRTDWRPFE